MTSLWSQLGNLPNWTQICEQVIRPQRNLYSVEELGPKEFHLRLADKAGCPPRRGRFLRTDLTLTNPRGLRLQCSHFEPVDCAPVKRPCIVYCHGNCGNRLTGIASVAALVLPYRISFFCFDFAGCGLSEGETISLGHFEQQDLACVVKYLRSLGTVSVLGLWGRSMGAVTCLLYAAKDPSVACMVLDSPFASLVTLIEELVERNVPQVPGFVTNLAIKALRRSVQYRAGFDIYQVNPVDAAKECFVPVLFAHGLRDGLIEYRHSEELLSVYQGEKKLRLLEDQDHNDLRPEFFRTSALIFLLNALQYTDEADIPDVKHTRALPQHRHPPPSDLDDEDSDAQSSSPSPSSSPRSSNSTQSGGAHKRQDQLTPGVETLPNWGAGAGTALAAEPEVPPLPEHQDPDEKGELASVVESRLGMDWVAGGDLEDSELVAALQASLQLEQEQQYRRRQQAQHTQDTYASPSPRDSLRLDTYASPGPRDSLRLSVSAGDGTLRGARAIYEQVKREKLPIAIVGIPKTIDNDITFIDHTFGFNTAVNLAQLSIETAHAEARSHENGIGLVKLMGRDSGFIAVYASLASGDVNLCLIPEVKFSVSALLNWLEKRLARKSHAVIVVAEGAGQDLCFTKGGGTDASGNVKLVDIGLWLKNEIQKGMAQRKVDITLKYIDPSYTIRSSKASCSDRVYCIELAHAAIHAALHAHAAIHAALHGCTGLMVSNINGRFCHVPLVCGKQKRKVVDTAGVAYQSLLLNSGMPLHLGGEGVASSKL
eukprot:g53426.t1